MSTVVSMIQKTPFRERSPKIFPVLSRERT
jgi:hypothetical protein